jgi:hypothetical protein
MRLNAISGVMLLLATATIGYAGPPTPTVGGGNNQVNQEWPHDSTSSDSKPNQSMTMTGPIDTPHVVAVQRPPAPPLRYSPMYKCLAGGQATFQDTPCSNGGLYHTKDTPITPVY